jgi:hypothetical protein
MGNEGSIYLDPSFKSALILPLALKHTHLTSTFFSAPYTASCITETITASLFSPPLSISYLTIGHDVIQPATSSGSMPNQQQNSGQPRGQYPAQNAGKQPGPQGSPGQHTSSQPLPDPQYSLWTIEKPLNAESWDVADPEQQYVSAEDVQERLVRFRRQGEDIPGILMQLLASKLKKML